MRLASFVIRHFWEQTLFSRHWGEGWGVGGGGGGGGGRGHYLH
jgi:hypothetical protein